MTGLAFSPGDASSLATADKAGAGHSGGTEDLEDKWRRVRNLGVGE